MKKKKEKKRAKILLQFNQVHLSEFYSLPTSVSVNLFILWGGLEVNIKLVCL